MQFNPSIQNNSSNQSTPHYGTKRAAPPADEQIQQVAKRRIAPREDDIIFLSDQETDEEQQKVARLTKEDREKLYPKVVEFLQEEGSLSVTDLFQKMRATLRNERQLGRILEYMGKEQIVTNGDQGWTLIDNGHKNCPIPQLEKINKRALIHLSEPAAEKVLFNKICKDLETLKKMTLKSAITLYEDYSKEQLKDFLQKMHHKGRLLYEEFVYSLDPDFIDPFIGQTLPVSREIWERLTKRQQAVTQYIADHPLTFNKQIVRELKCGYRTVTSTFKALGSLLVQTPSGTSPVIFLSLSKTNAL